MRKLLIATSNPDKIREIREILADAPVECVALADFPPVAAPEETGLTFAENARAKALFYARATGALAVAQDTGQAIDAMGGAPGVHSARYGGVDSSYPEKFARIYAGLREKNAYGSAARFVCALALAQNGRVLFEAEGVVEGVIAPEPKGEGGFGYDPIFFYPPFGTTLAEAADRKSAVSHRGQAFRKLRAFLIDEFLDLEA
jgi:XTP/dITP diphosphohydrolase